MPRTVSVGACQVRQAQLAGGTALALGVLFVALGIAATHGVTQSTDQSIMLAIHGWTTATLTVTIQAITELGAWYVTIPVCVLQAIAYYRHDARLSAVALVLAIGTAPVVVDGFKLVFARPRPDVFTPLVVEQGFSYPSGHVTLATVAYGFSALFLVSRLPSPSFRAGALSGVITLVLLVGLSRVYLGVHYPSDVVGGILLGTTWIAVWYGLPRIVHGIGPPAIRSPYLRWRGHE